ncbi:TetR/AcrR family transcriptional regulator [Evansella tamaricis]|uniref:TetR/AcrR family transcriptional regulator n=1 Tax=Evansella tamaricis TaxID=2069301 RepID=A0ABS6JJM7_9BACI|nr:TetR/AcrR family transcriptional regulator [Evansella tamaricis]MBU9713848.1 TetR/AcrR family transcriptional regulator [Evansella tamaricis]
MNSPKNTFNRISEAKQKKIIESALTEFAEKGYTSANINIIAEKAGVSIGAMYKYFENKEDLYMKIIAYAVEKLNGVLGEIVTSHGNLIVKIEQIIKAIQKHTRENVYLTKLYNQMTTESHPEIVQKIVSDMEGISAQLYAAQIIEAQKKGEIRKDIDPKMFGFYLDNLFILLQFSYSCDYYKERLKMFVGEDVFEKDEAVCEELMKFIKGAFFLK